MRFLNFNTFLHTFKDTITFPSSFSEQYLKIKTAEDPKEGFSFFLPCVCIDLVVVTDAVVAGVISDTLCEVPTVLTGYTNAGLNG